MESQRGRNRRLEQEEFRELQGPLDSCRAPLLTLLRATSCGFRVTAMASHGLQKRLPYVLVASPFPVNRDYVGASSSWSGVCRVQR